MKSLADTMRDIIEETEGRDPLVIRDVLSERGSRYGCFSSHALISQSIKSAMKHSSNWHKLPADMKEALEMVAHKIARLLNGDFEYADNVIDIIGYMTLVLDRMTGDSEHGLSEKMGKPNRD